MKPNSYEVLAGRTMAAPDQPRARLRRNLYLLGHLLELRKNAGGVEVASDRLKREIFYGQDKGLGTILPHLPPGKSNFHVAQLAGAISLGHVDLLHAGLGVLSEAGELFSAITSHVIDGKDFDAVNAKEECGDLCWYIAILCRMFGFSFADIQDRNIEKLRARYGDKFSDVAAITRDLGRERQILEADTSAQDAEDFAVDRKLLEGLIETIQSNNDLLPTGNEHTDLHAILAMHFDGLRETAKNHGWEPENESGPITPVSHLYGRLEQLNDAIGRAEQERDEAREGQSDLLHLAGKLGWTDLLDVSAAKYLEKLIQEQATKIASLHKDLTDLADLRKWQEEQRQRREDAAASRSIGDTDVHETGKAHPGITMTERAPTEDEARRIAAGEQVGAKQIHPEIARGVIEQADEAQEALGVGSGTPDSQGPPGAEGVDGKTE